MNSSPDTSLDLTMRDEKSSVSRSTSERTLVRQPQTISAPVVSVRAVASRRPSSQGDVESQRTSSSSDSSHGKNVTVCGAVVLMLKTEIGLGVLGLPLVFSVLGLFFGVVLLLFTRLTVLWSGWQNGRFMLNHPDKVTGMPDAAELIFGKHGRYWWWIIAFVFSCFWIFVVAAGQLSTSVMLNGMTLHGAPTWVFVAISFFATFVGSSIPNLERVSYIAWIGITMILAALWTFVGVVASQPWEPSWQLFVASPASAVFAAVSTIIFAHSGTPAFFTVMAEMKDRKKYFRALCISQFIMGLTYIGIATVLYCTVGSNLKAPILATLEETPRRIISGFVFAAVIASTILLNHISAKEIFRWITNDIPKWNLKDRRACSCWIACTFGTSFIAYVLASTIPIFDSLVSLTGALFVPILVFFMPAGMWLYDNWSNKERVRDFRWKLQAFWALFVLLLATVLFVGCVYGSCVELHKALKSGYKTTPWTSADNSIPIMEASINNELQ